MKDETIMIIFNAIKILIFNAWDSGVMQSENK